jgi:hypothetical protein
MGDDEIEINEDEFLTMMPMKLAKLKSSKIN